MARTDDDAKDKSRGVVNSLSRDMKSVGKFLVGVVKGTVQDEITEEITDKAGVTSKRTIKKPATLSVRVSAAKQYKELIVDKLLEDVKQNPKKPETSRTKYKDALSELEASISAEKVGRN